MFSLLVNIPANAKWAQNGVTIAGGHGYGDVINQLNFPLGLFVDDDQTVVIADFRNHRIMQWKIGDTTNGQVVAGGNGAGNGLNQLNYPTDVLIDKVTDSLIICDRDIRRVVRWSRRSGTTQGEILFDNIYCWGLAMDEQRCLYVSNTEKHEVRRYKLGLLVDTLGTVYVADEVNCRVIRWTQEAKQGTVIVGGNGPGAGANQFHFPYGLSFDRHGNLYVADALNNRVQRFSMI
ncbi:unnamed protein product [Rotaria magnacalcarata]|uniref:NHL repeat-containing protein n=1 Tax=Rotaria magnacalcarata TaxID=392030 RepID=A0A816HJS5_9BILA|nr:unnamed protein product [Rotaria magnacalcarata]